MHDNELMDKYLKGKKMVKLLRKRLERRFESVFMRGYIRACKDYGILLIDVHTEELDPEYKEMIKRKFTNEIVDK